MRWNYDGFFFKGVCFLLGNWNGDTFSCHGKSGGQSLWLPFSDDVGLRLFHRKGQTATLHETEHYFQAQTILAEEELSPKPLDIYEIRASFRSVMQTHDEEWERCYGITMEPVRRGSLSRVLRNLGLFGVQVDDNVKSLVRAYLRWFGDDGLSGGDYVGLSRFLGVDGETRLKQMLAEADKRIPAVLRRNVDFLSYRNVVFDQDGELKIVDCDESGL